MEDIHKLDCKYRELETIPVFYQKDYVKGDLHSMYTTENEILFVEEGILLVRLGQYSNIYLEKGSLFMVPPGYNLSYDVKENTTVIGVRLTNEQDFCECFATQGLITQKNPQKYYAPVSLKTNEILIYFLGGIKTWIKNNMRCPNFSQLKIKELFFILGHTYTKKELFEFFYFHLSSDTSFSRSVHNLYSDVKNVSELAQVMNYSLSGFQKHFKKVFGMPPSEWLSLQKSRKVYSDLVRNVPIKIISEKYNFNSLSHFNTFCVKYFGETPRKIQNPEKH